MPRPICKVVIAKNGSEADPAGSDHHPLEHDLVLNLVSNPERQPSSSISTDRVNSDLGEFQLGFYHINGFTGGS